MHRTLRFLTILLLLGFHNLSFCGETEIPNYFIAMEGNNVSGLIKINGCPIEQINNARSLMHSEHINKWLVNGTNTIEVTYPDYLHESDEEMTLHLQKGSSLAGSDKLALLKASPSKKVFYEFEINDIPDSDLPKAEYIDELSYEDQDEIHNLVTRLYKSMDGESFPAFMNLMKLKLSEEAKTTGVSVEQFQQVFERGYKQNFRNGLKRYKILDPDEMKYSIVFKSKIVHVSGKKSFGIIFHIKEENFYGLPVYVSRIKGEWKIIR